MHRLHVALDHALLGSGGSQPIWLLPLVCLCLSACAGAGEERENELRPWVEYQPWDSALAKLEPETVEWILSFSASIPDRLPDGALPQVNLLRHNQKPLASDRIVALEEGEIAGLELVVGNPSGRANRTESVLCFLNGVQQRCSPTGYGWLLNVPAKAVAFVPIILEAEPGDRIDVFLIPVEQPGYPFPIAVGLNAFVESRTWMEPEVEVAKRERIWPFEGCDSARILTEPPPIKVARPPSDASRDGNIYLLIELCQPNQIIRLVAIADRQSQVNINERAWQRPLRVMSNTALIPVDPSWLREAEEFQIAILKDEFGEGQGRAILFSDAASFID